MAESMVADFQHKCTAVVDAVGRFSMPQLRDIAAHSLKPAETLAIVMQSPQIDKITHLQQYGTLRTQKMYNDLCSPLHMTSSRGHEAFKFIGFFSAGAMTSLAFRRYVYPHRHFLKTWGFSRRQHQHGQVSSLAQVDKCIQRSSYALGYSNFHRCALWCSFYMCKRSLAMESEVRTETFKTDPLVDAQYRNQISDFTNTGYDRGHLAPRASVAFSKDSAEDSFFLSNVALQHPDLNRKAWKMLEGLTRRWANRHRGELLVTVGPIFQSETPKRVNGMAVADYFFMAILHPKSRNSIAFAMPNRSLAKEVSSAEDLFKFAIPLTQLEALLRRNSSFKSRSQRSSMRLFTNVPKKMRPLRPVSERSLPIRVLSRVPVIRNLVLGRLSGGAETKYLACDKIDRTFWSVQKSVTSGAADVKERKTHRVVSKSSARRQQSLTKLLKNRKLKKLLGTDPKRTISSPPEVVVTVASATSDDGKDQTMKPKEPSVLRNLAFSSMNAPFLGRGSVSKKAQTVRRPPLSVADVKK